MKKALLNRKRILEVESGLINKKLEAINLLIDDSESLNGKSTITNLKSAIGIDANVKSFKSLVSRRRGRRSSRKGFIASGKPRLRNHPRLKFNISQLIREVLGIVGTSIDLTLNSKDICLEARKLGFNVPRDLLDKSISALVSHSNRVVRKSTQMDNEGRKLYYLDDHSYDDVSLSKSKKRIVCSLCNNKFVVRDGVCASCYSLRAKGLTIYGK